MAPAALLYQDCNVHNSEKKKEDVNTLSCWQNSSEMLLLV